MSDLVSELAQEPPNVANVDPPSAVEGVSDNVGSCFESAKANTSVTVPLSTKTPDLECVISEQDALKGEEGDALADCSAVSNGTD